MLVEQLHVPPQPSWGTSRRRGPASTGERAGCVLPLLRCSRVLVEHQPLHGLEPGFTHGIKSNDRALPLNHTARLGVQTAPILSGKRFVRGRAQIAPEGEKEPFFPCWNHEGSSAQHHGPNPQLFLRHPAPHALPASSKSAVFLSSAGRGEGRRCPACTSLPANGNSGSGPRLGFPRLVQPSEKLAVVLLLPSAWGLEQGWEPGEGAVRVSRCSRRRRLRPAAHRVRVPRGAAVLPAASCFWGTLEAQFPSLSHLGADL